MFWLFLLLAIAGLAFAFYTPSVALAAVSLLVALLALIAWVTGLLSRRAADQSLDGGALLDTQELRRLSEQVEMHRAAAHSGMSTGGGASAQADGAVAS